MLLDASTDADLNSCIFGNIKTHTIEARRYAVIYQVRGKSFSRQSITGEGAFGKSIRPQEAEELRKGIVQFIAGRAEHHSCILVVAQKRVATMLKEYLKPYIDAGGVYVTHFSATKALTRASITMDRVDLWQARLALKTLRLDQRRGEHHRHDLVDSIGLLRSQRFHRRRSVDGRRETLLENQGKRSRTGNRCHRTTAGFRKQRSTGDHACGCRDGVCESLCRRSRRRNDGCNK